MDEDEQPFGIFLVVVKEFSEDFFIQGPAGLFYC